MMRTPEERAAKLAKRHPVCDKDPAHGKLAYFAQVDAKGCVECDEWRENKCGDIDCGFCANRPERPSDLIGP